MPLKAGTYAAAILLTLSGSTAAASPATPVPGQSLRARLSDEVIKQAVRETLAENPVEREAAPSGQVLSGGQYLAFSRNFSEAQKPSCMGPDALKFQPAEMSTKDWHFAASGLMTLPFWAAALVKGKCQ